MSNIFQNPRKAARAAIDRLLQMRQLWEDAAESYFEPSRFMLSLQNCITTSRTVSFILQSNKADIPDFDQWYEMHRSKWSADPIMRWARDARNSIEKKGDLETNSQVRAEIIAGFLEGPTTDWLPQALFLAPSTIWKAVPTKFRIPHILENGTLMIERRWVDSELPNVEVLEALAHVYGELCNAIVDLLQSNDIPIPKDLDRSRPDPMGELAMDRALYLSMRDGSPAGMRYYKKPMERPSDDDRNKVVKRYGKTANWGRLKLATTFREVAEAYFENARAVINRDGYHHNFTFLLKGSQPIEMVRSDHPDRASRYVLMRDLAKLARIAGADGVMMIGETWTASNDDIPPSGFAVDAKNRGEAIMLSAASAKGESFMISAPVIRKRPGSLKVKSVGRGDYTDDGFQFMFVPFFKEWGCLDEKAMQQAFDNMDNMGILHPTIGGGAAEATVTGKPQPKA